MSAPTPRKLSLQRVKAAVLRRLGITGTMWARVVMDRTTDQHVRGLGPKSLDACEISGEKWAGFGFKSYRSIQYPEQDICTAPAGIEAYDLVIAEQVLEHVLTPADAVKNVHRMLKPGGTFVVTTPFLLKIHNYPVDCSRWTPLGLKCLLEGAGFPASEIETGSWGNRACIRVNFNDWRTYVPLLHSLKNEPDFPIVVWAFARKA